MNDMDIIRVGQYGSPCGPLMLGAVGDKLCLCDWVQSGHHERVCGRLARLLDAEFEYGSSTVIDIAKRQLDEFFGGNRREFDVPLLLAGTAFQKRVWSELLGIPYGHTVSYMEIAERINAPESVRAVANAVGANALSLFIPCHRVIGSDGSLTGYAGGLQAKRKLLDLEGTWHSFRKVCRTTGYSVEKV